MERDERPGGAFPPAPPGRHVRWLLWLMRSTDTYGMVLALIVLSYIATSAAGGPLDRVFIVALQGLTLVLALRTSRAHPVWVLLAGVVFVVATVSATVAALDLRMRDTSGFVVVASGTLLLVAPLAILRRIASHRVITAQTILGAICVYLLFGMAFAFIYGTIAWVTSTPFFAGVPQPTPNDYLFFSFSTLTTVGYGNLVPAGHLGQGLAMLEALTGQIYLVIIVARLVSLWGQERPRSSADRDDDGDGT